MKLCKLLWYAKALNFSVTEIKGQRTTLHWTPNPDSSIRLSHREKWLHLVVWGLDAAAKPWKCTPQSSLPPFFWSNLNATRGLEMSREWLCKKNNSDKISQLHLLDGWHPITEPHWNSLRALKQPITFGFWSCVRLRRLFWCINFFCK